MQYSKANRVRAQPPTALLLSRLHTKRLPSWAVRHGAILAPPHPLLTYRLPLLHWLLTHARFFF